MRALKEILGDFKYFLGALLLCIGLFVILVCLVSGGYIFVKYGPEIFNQAVHILKAV